MKYLQYVLFFITVGFGVTAGALDIKPPTTPTGLKGTPSATSIALSWTRSTDASGIRFYELFRNGARLVTPSGTSYTDSGLVSLTTYRYKVRAIDRAGNRSAFSTEISVTTLEAPPPVVGIIGYIGCSMTKNVAEGALSIDATSVWSPIPKFDGGSVGKLAPSTASFWSLFQTAYTAQPTNIIWWELCSIFTDSANETIENAWKVIENIEAIVPNAVIYVSAQPLYSPVDHVCSISGADGPVNMQSLATSLSTFSPSDNILAGPVMGPLKHPEDTIDDGCHADTTGKTLMGTQLLDFFR